MIKNRKIMTIIGLAMLLCVVTAGSAFAWSAGTGCVANTFGVAATTATGNFEVLYCNIENAVTGYIGGTIALMLIIWGIYQGGFGQGGVVAAVPMIIMGLILGMSPTMVGWLGITVDRIPLL
ncbi:Uncharacterized protein dnl_07150 [Desulfonema limicola]|uniref:Uncharacterized protein n=1 Tax=Desulfonema limicola TaxID=45656 RepID=A0A975GES2_9BACT|nr:hypothetical protein [Desulfonema limicola]QTA78493.1 Uncharacterized protein dnl_07150 [Desulfonema limicola]